MQFFLEELWNLILRCRIFSFADLIMDYVILLVLGDLLTIDEIPEEYGRIMSKK